MSSPISTHVAALFAAESEAIVRLRWFAETADVDGYPDLAASFRAIADEKAGHALGLLEFVDGLDRETGENLAAALVMVDRQDQLQEVIDQAVSEGRHEVAEWVETIAAASARQLERLRSGEGQLR